MAYRARHWACALDILELAATAASAGESAAAAAAARKSGELPEAAASAAAAVGRESGGLPSSSGPNDEGGLAAASWSDWSHKLMAKHEEFITFTHGTCREHMLASALAAPNSQS